MKHLIPALRIYLVLTIVTGVFYPLLVTVVGALAFSKNASGSLIERDGNIVGSELIAQKFESEKYFWPRPSAVDYNLLPSGGSNLGPTSAALTEAVSMRRAKVGNDAPQDLLFASASGLDPAISPAAAVYQIPRVAKARGVPEATVRSTVQELIQKRQFGFLGEETVNVLKLNLRLDERK